MARRSHGPVSVIILLATVFLPPLGVFLLDGCGPEFIIAICLTILGWFPGVIYAVFLWLKAGGFAASGSAEVRVDKVKQRCVDVQTKIKAKKAQRTVAAASGSGKPAGRQAAGEPPQPIARVIESVLQEAAEETPNPGLASRRKPMRKTMRDSKKPQMPSIQAVASSTTPSSAVVAARAAAGATSAVPKTSAGTDCVPTETADQSATRVVLDKATAQEADIPRASIALGRVLQTDDEAKSAVQTSVTAETSKATAESALRVPGGYESRPQSAAAPGTPGASAVVNPQISTIRAVKDVEVKDA